ncbi:MAG: transporter [Gallionellaceae bacterium]
MRNKLWLIATLNIILLTPCFAKENPAVTPYRSTVSNPAALSQSGWLELEAGWLSSKSRDDSTRGSLPYMLKFAFAQNSGVLLGGEAFVNQTVAQSSSISGLGDTSFLLKHRFGVSENGSSAFGMEYGFVAATAKEGLNGGSGKTDHLINGIYSADLSGNTIDINLNLTTLGSVSAGESKQQWGWVATWSRPLNEKWGVAAELFGSIRSGFKPSDQALVSVNYALSKRVVWDAGLAAGLNDSTPKWSLLAGVTVLVGKLY